MSFDTPCLTFRVVDIRAIVAGEVGAILVSVLHAIFFSGCKNSVTSGLGRQSAWHAQSQAKLTFDIKERRRWVAVASAKGILASTSNNGSLDWAGVAANWRCA